MKKDPGIFLVVLTLMFAAFVMGMLVGRSTYREPVTLQLAESPKTTLPAKEESIAPAATAPSGDGRININTAHVDLLDTLPGIGPVLAKRIVDYRRENGPFQSISELSLVEGIGGGTMLEIYDLVTVED